MYVFYIIFSYTYDSYSHNGHSNLTERSLNHTYNFTRGFPVATMATFAAITYSPLVRHFFTSKNKAIYQGFSQTSTQLDAIFTLFLQQEWWIYLSQGISHLLDWTPGKLQWVGAQQPPLGTRGEAYSSLTCGNTGKLPTLASIISFLDLRSQKSEVFQQLKVLGL